MLRAPFYIRGHHKNALPLTLHHRSGKAGRKSFLVPLDGTRAAEWALPMAIALARSAGAQLRLMHVRSADPQEAKSELILLDDGCEARFRLRSDCYLERMARRITEASGIDVSTETIAGPRVALALRDVCASGVDLVVLSRRQRSILGWLWQGSTVDRVVHNLNVPVVVVPEGAREPELTEARLERVLLPLDTHERSQPIVDHTLHLARSAREYWLMSVIPLWMLAQTHRAGSGTTAAMGSHAAGLRNQAWFRLSHARDKLRRAGKQAEATVVFDELSAGRAIVSHAEAYRADLIALTGRKRFLPWWLSQGTPQYVVRHAPVPVLICPAAD